MMVKTPEVKMNKKKVHGFQREPFGKAFGIIDAPVSSRGNKGAIWGYGLWPPEWTIVPNVSQDENCSTIWKA